ncbi:receptor-like protein 43 [Magnolia sinica]|uniref:receptor-like protein 43 n=1 Tax=Magnolia sinica TaxID=86752 RepID=UPI002658F304|nr:receptor-like protein 43 [Magnolia sinica]
MKELRHLNLSDAGFSGSIPHPLGNLSKLISLKLSSDYSLSAKNLWWLTSLPSLHYLHMSYVNLSMASHDWVHVMNMSPSLVELSLFDYGLSYISPTLSSVNFTSLRVLDLCGNNFNSTIPNWIANISSLVSLHLSYNNFHGEVPYQFSQLPNLEVLGLGSTDDNLRVDWSEFLEGSWRKLKILYLSFSQLHGGIPNSIWKMTSLESLSLSFSENITGSIPRAITKLINLERLSLDGYKMHAVIPDWLYELKNLKHLTLIYCMLTGPIPEALGGLFSLQILSLRGNQLNGTIPTTLGQLSNLYLLDLSDNSLTGNVSESVFENLTKLSFENLLAMKNDQKINHVLSYGGARSSYYKENLLVSVKGQMLEYTKTISLVTCIDISRNNLSGEIPEGLIGLLGLRALNLFGNHLTGKIPDEIGKLTLLESLDFSENQLSGIIPLSMSNLTFLSCLNLSFNNLWGEIPSGNQLQTFQDPSIYMGNNRLCGPLLLDKCASDETPPGPGDLEEDEEEDEIRWFYSGLGPGFAVGFGTLCGILVLKRSWRIVYYHFYDEMKDRLFY